MGMLLLLLIGSVFGSVTAHALPAENRELVQLYHYKPIYFLLGKPNTKVQFSVRAKVLKNYSLYVGYSQLILWDLFKTSRPFADINYNPEIFYRWSLPDWTVDIVPYEHESNGKSGLESRSWDRSAVRVTREWAMGEERILETQFKVWWARNFDDTNSDLPRYRGLYEGQVAVKNLFGEEFGMSELIFRFYPGGKTHIDPIKGGRELTLRFRSRAQYSLFQMVFQVFEGHAESLIHYKNHVWGFRAGLGF